MTPNPLPTAPDDRGGQHKPVWSGPGVTYPPGVVPEVRPVLKVVPAEPDPAESCEVWDGGNFDYYGRKARAEAELFGLADRVMWPIAWVCFAAVVVLVVRAASPLVREFLP